MGVKLCKRYNKQVVDNLECLLVVDNLECLECLECPLVALILTNLLKAVFLVTFSPHDLPSLLIQR